MNDKSDLIENINALLHEEYEKNKEFNEALDEKGIISFSGLNPDNDEYKYLRSRILYMVDPTAYDNELTEWVSFQNEEKHIAPRKWLKKTNQISDFDDLVNALRRKRVIPFVGGGLSVPCGMPAWENALIEIADAIPDINKVELEKLLATNDYFNAAQLIFDTNNAITANKISTIFRLISSTEIRGPVKLLPHLTAGPVITTNFDEIIERVFEDKGSDYSFREKLYGLQVTDFPGQMINGERCILKIHGHVQSPASLVLTREQYESAYGSVTRTIKKPIARTLRQIYISQNLLFLGCSLEQDRTLDLFTQVKKKKDFEIPRHFALLPEPEKDAEKVKKTTRLLELSIIPLWYPPENDHRMLEELLRLAVEIASGQAENI